MSIRLALKVVHFEKNKTEYTRRGFTATVWRCSRGCSDHAVTAVTHFFKTLLYLVQLALEYRMFERAAQQGLQVSNGGRLATVSVGANLTRSRRIKVIQH